MNGPQMHGTTSQWKMTVPFRTVMVESVDGPTSTVRDLGGGASYRVQNTMPNGLRPEPGDIWRISNDSGQWQFFRALDPTVPRVATMRDASRVLDRRGLYEHAPFENPLGGVAEAPVGAYIGQRALFEVRPDTRWLLEDGSAVSRYRYPELFDLLGTRYGPGDGVETFNLPTQFDSSADIALVQSSYATISTSDYTVTTTLTQVPGFVFSFTIPTGATPSNYFVEVSATIVQDYLFSGSSTTSELVARLDGTIVTDSGQNHSTEFLNASNGRYWESQTWKIVPSTTGAHTVDLAISKAAAVSTIFLVRKNCTMHSKLYRGGGSVASSSPAQWYILAE